MSDMKIKKICTKGIITFCTCLIISIALSDNLFAQHLKINFSNTPLKTVLKAVTEQSGYNFVYSDAVKVAVEQKVTCSIEKNATNGKTFTQDEIKTLLSQLLKGTNLSYSLKGNHIALYPKGYEQNQSKTLNGVITDETGEPLPGVTIQNKATGKITASDIDGRYNIEAEEGDELLFTFVGMQDFSSIAGKSSVANIIMKTDAIALENVVITGYQTISKERATGSYVIVNSEVIAQKPTSNISDILGGIIPGLAVSSNSVDGTPRFVIRGQGTLQKDQLDKDPLIVVDGFPINGYSTNSDPFSTINPNDVENITVLKDASATSIYGARAANGVIVITTKKAKGSSKLDISADAFVSVSSKPDLDYAFNMASAENQFRYVELMNKYTPVNISGTQDPYLMATARRVYYAEPYSLIWEKNTRASISEQEYSAKRAELIALGNNKIWEKQIKKYLMRNAVKQQYNMALRGSSERIDYAFSASYNSNDTYMVGNGGKRVNLNMQSSAKITKNLSFNVSLNTVFSKTKNNGESIENLKTYVSPWTRFIDESGNYLHVPTAKTIYYPILLSEYNGKTPASWLYNPVEDLKYRHNTTKSLNYRVQGGLNYKTEWGLGLSAKGQYEYGRTDGKNMYDIDSYYVRDLYNTYSTLNPATGLYESYLPAGGVFTDTGNKYDSYNLRGQADFNRTFGKHTISAIAGTEVISSTTDVIPSVTRYGFNKNTYSVLSTPDYVTRKPNIFGVNSLMPYQGLGALSQFIERYFSAYANASYTFNNKYSITGSFRTDATNYQTKETREKFSPFWSVGGSWIMTQENFLKDVKWLNMLKIRASIGIAGVSAGKNNNSTVTTLKTYPGNITYTNNEPFSVIAMRGNPSLTWEKSRTLNIGVDFDLFGSRLYGSIDYYNKYSYDVLAKATVPVISQGTDSANYNNAKVSNKGIEISLNSNIRIAGDLRWSGNLNIAYNTNKILEYNVTSQSPILNMDYLKGYPIDAITVAKLKGYTKEGFVILQGKDGKDETLVDYTSSHLGDQIERQNGMTLDDHNYFYYLGTSTPKYEMGFTNRFTYKGITLSFLITGRFNYWVYKNQIFDYNMNNPYFSKELDRSFKVYDEGYANQKKYVAFPLYNDENANVFTAAHAYNYTYNMQLKNIDSYQKGDHLRLQEVYLGYELPTKLLDKQRVVKSATIYLQGSNLGLIYSSKKGFDPDYVYGNIKPMRTFTFGIKVNFK